MGTALTRGNWHAPVCTDCHGIHTIKAPSDPKSAVAAGNVGNTCGSCHESVKLSNGVRGRREIGFRPTSSSYHGMASRVGSATVANCASCHGVHNILPSSDPRSTINHANLAKTCGQCHPGANDKFITSKVHLDGATNKADVGHQGHRPHQQVLHLDDRRRDRRHGAAQPAGLPQETGPASHRASADSVPHDAGTARAAPDLADQLLHPGAHRICLALSVVVAGDRVYQRARAQPDSSHRRSGPDCGQHVPYLVYQRPIPTDGS